MASSEQLLEQIRAGMYDEKFAKLYGATPQEIQGQRERYAQAVEEFEKLYGKGRETAIYSAPGRTEIGGNHTDHNHGVVMAAAVNLDIIAVVSRNKDNVIRVKSKGFSNMDEVSLQDISPNAKEHGRSSGIIRGVAAGIKKEGGEIGGFDAYTTSDVLRGSGLSSSAAFEVCMGAVLNGEYNDGKFSSVQLGLIGQYAENVFFGKPSGLMDQTASAVGGAITIDFMDPAIPVVQEVPLHIDKAGLKLVITDTKGSHAGLTDEYAAIRQEMEEIAGYFGAKVLRDVSRQDVMDKVPALRKKFGDRAVLRAIHFYEECRRVAVLTEAAETEDMGTFLRTIIESGHSSFEYNQNAYSVTNPQEQGMAIGLAVSQMVLQGTGGAWRLQGGGFAGTIQAFVPVSVLGDYCRELEAIFGEGSCYVLNVRDEGAIKVTH